MYLSRLFLMAILIFSTIQALSQSYPVKPVKIIVPYAPGGTGDILARLVAQKLAQQLGQSFLIENKTGAGGLIGYGVVARSAPDGYNLIAMSNSYTMFPSLYGEHLDWNIETDIIPISLYGRASFALIVNPIKNYKSTQDLIRQAKMKPDEISYGTPGTGSLHHVFTALLSEITGVSMIHIPYKGASEALNAVLANGVDWAFVALPTITGQLNNERMRVIAVTSDARFPLIPKVPTLRESGINMSVSNWFGLGAPKGTPPETIAILNKQISDAVKSPDVSARMKEMGAEGISNNSADFAQMINNDIRVWTKVIKEAGIKN